MEYSNRNKGKQLVGYCCYSLSDMAGWLDEWMDGQMNREMDKYQWMDVQSDRLRTDFRKALQIGRIRIKKDRIYPCFIQDQQPKA